MQRASGFVRGFGGVVVGSMVVAGVMIGLLWWRSHGSDRNKTVIVYVAEGVKPPLQNAAERFEKEYGVHVEIISGNSGSLLASIEVRPGGDLYMPADESFVEKARKKELVAESFPVAAMSPVLVVSPGNPKGVKSLDDLLRSEVRVGQCREEAAIGAVAKRLLEKAGLWEPVKARATMKTVVTELAGDLKIGSLDAGIVWDANARQFGLTIVDDARLSEPPTRVSIAILRQSPNTALARQFARYLADPHHGGPHFKQAHYQPIPPGGKP